MLHRSLLLLVLLVAPVAAGHAQDCVSPPVGLVGWWPGNGDALDIADGNPGTLVNGAGFGAGMVGQAFALDGIADYVAVEHASNIDITGDLAVDAWIEPSNLGDQRVIVSKRSYDNQNANIIFFVDTDGRLVFSSRSGGGSFTDARSTNPVPVGQWTFVAVTISGTMLTIYINGLLDASASYTATRPANTGRLTIGIVEIDPLIWPPTGLVAPFAGSLDEIELAGRALSGSEIQGIFAAGSAGKCRYPVGVGAAPWTGVKRLFR